ncbi:MAG: hypothetical protein JST04_14940 [Bdellovibrionales bacterium]|nr:hypothetical protein [Bdellovibrionales bacterium]
MRRFGVILMAVLFSTSGFAGPGGSVVLFGGDDLSEKDFAALGLVEPSCAEAARNAIEPEVKEALGGILALPTVATATATSQPVVVCPTGGGEGERSDVVTGSFPEAVKLTTEVVDSPIAKTSLKDVACVAAAQKVFGETHLPYRSCPGDASKTELPCRTRNSATVMARAFDLVSECVGVDRRELFLQAVKTNGFVPDAWTPTDEGFSFFSSEAKKIDAGIGANAFCKSLDETVKAYAAEKSKSICERMKRPAGFLLPLYFLAKSQRALRVALENAANDNWMKDRFGNEYETILRAAIHASIGRGPAKALSVFRAVAKVAEPDKTGKDMPVTDAKRFLELYAKHLEEFPGAAAEVESQSSRVKELMGGRECF